MILTKLRANMARGFKTKGKQQKVDYSSDKIVRTYTELNRS